MRDQDQFWMKQALREAVKGWGTTNPNPLVGAVVVRDGKLIGKGYHIRPGEGHAEVNAIANCGRKKTAGATIYVTLEPCCTYGRTPPCTEAIIKAGITRVVFGCTDPNPQHAGRAVRILEQNGIEVCYPVCEKECRRLNEPFFNWSTTGKPYVLLKMAETLDGKIATENGCSQWITGALARKRVQQLRKRADAVMGGAETFRLDHPRFTVRDAHGNTLKTPRRIIVTHHPEQFEQDGFDFVSLDHSEDWDRYLRSLGTEKITTLLIEGGGELAASALAAGAVDRVEFHIAPKILGGRDSRSSVAGTNPGSLSESWHLEDVELRKAGTDLIYSARVKYNTEKDL